jgi:hypothetical protein
MRRSYRTEAHLPPNSQELARLTAANDAHKNKLTTLQADAKFKAVGNLAFTSGTKYMSLQGCGFK